MVGSPDPYTTLMGYATSPCDEPATRLITACIGYSDATAATGEQEQAQAPQMPNAAYAQYYYGYQQSFVPSLLTDPIGYLKTLPTLPMPDCKLDSALPQPAPMPAKSLQFWDGLRTPSPDDLWQPPTPQTATGTPTESTPRGRDCSSQESQLG